MFRKVGRIGVEDEWRGAAGWWPPSLRSSGRPSARRLRGGGRKRAGRREGEQARLRYVRVAAMDERERKRLYAESRTAEVAAMSADLADTLIALDGVPAATLDVDNYFNLAHRRSPTSTHPRSCTTAAGGSERMPTSASNQPTTPGGSIRHIGRVPAGRPQRDARHCA